MFLSKRDFLLISFQEQDKPSKKTCLEFSLYIALVRFLWFIFSCASCREQLGAKGRALRIQLRLDRLKLQISSSSTFDLGLSCGKTVPAF